MFTLSRLEACKTYILLYSTHFVLGIGRYHLETHIHNSRYAILTSPVTHTHRASNNTHEFLAEIGTPLRFIFMLALFIIKIFSQFTQHVTYVFFSPQYHVFAFYSRRAL